MTRENLERTRRLMCAAVRDCMVTGHEGLVAQLELPDEDDRAVAPDEFVRSATGLSYAVISRVLREQAQALKDPPTSMIELLDRLSTWLPQTVAELRSGGLGSE